MPPTLQSLINFPVRKTRSSSRNLDKNKFKNIKEFIEEESCSPESKKTESLNSTPRKRIQNRAISASCSPPKQKKESSKTPRVSRKFGLACKSTEDENVPPSISQGCLAARSQSPSEKPGVTENDAQFPRSPLKSCNQAMSSPQKRESLTIKKIENLALSSPVRKSANNGIHRSNALQPYQKLKHSFASSHCSHLVGRESQMSTLEEFLSSHLLEGLPGSIYISGAPGTGKTASVSYMVEKLKVPKLKSVFLNCMAQKSSNDIFTQIALNLDLTTSKREMRPVIEHSLTTSKVPILLILDEVDQLESKHQEVLYTIFEWPSLANSKLVLIGIANMLDLTDRILPRLQANSTCRPQLLHFAPYSKAEIVSIISDRIKEADLDNKEIFKPAAINFLAGKISAVAGDVRKALDVCRRAVELCEIKTRNQMLLKESVNRIASPKKCGSSLRQIDIPLILLIFNEVFGSRVTPSIVNEHCAFPHQQKVLLAALLLILKNGKVQDVTVGKFHEVYSRVCHNQKLAVVDHSEFFSLCNLMEARGLLQVKLNKEPRNSKIISRLNQEEAEFALGDEYLLATILNDVSSLGKLAKKTKTIS